MLRNSTPDFVRRKLLAIGGGLAITPVAGLAGGRQTRFDLAATLTSQTTLLDEELHGTLSALCETLFGHRFTQADREELGWRIEYLVREDPRWRTPLERLGSYLDRQAVEASDETFLNVGDEVRSDVLKRMMKHSEDAGLGSRLISALFGTEKLPSMHVTSIRRIESLYIDSGIPWRRRGYESWPGIAGDMLEYTRPGQRG